MTVVAASDSPVPHEVTPVAKAAVLLTAAGYLREFGFTPPTSQEIADACGVSRSQAYSLKIRLESAWATALVRTSGRPAMPKPAAPHPITTDDLGPLGETWTANSVSYACGRLYHRTASSIICASVRD